MLVIEEHIVPPGISKVRLSDYGVGIFESIFSRKGVKKAIKRGLFLVNGQVAGTGFWVESGQKISLLDEERKPSAFFPLKLDVVFEDAHLAVVIKPGGLVVSANQFRTLENALQFNLQPSGEIDELPLPRCVHRLDALTSGLILVAKTRRARIYLGQQFENKQVKKGYQAVVMGHLPQSGIFDQQVGGKQALTRFSTVRTVPSLRSGHLSLANLFPETGRTHQLRIHLSEAGFPILGDGLYGKEGAVFKGKGLFLCAVGLSFSHPITGRSMQIEVESPNKFQIQMDREEKRWNKFKG